MQDPTQINVQIIAQLTMQVIIKWVLAFLFCFLWVGPILLPWIYKIVSLFTLAQGAS